jgi:hypothetical protein
MEQLLFMSMVTLLVQVLQDWLLLIDQVTLWVVWMCV